jgi:hypothetical protein
VATDIDEDQDERVLLNGLSQGASYRLNKTFLINSYLSARWESLSSGYYSEEDAGLSSFGLGVQSSVKLGRSFSGVHDLLIEPSLTVPLAQSDREIGPYTINRINILSSSAFSKGTFVIIQGLGFGLPINRIDDYDVVQYYAEYSLGTKVRVVRSLSLGVFGRSRQTTYQDGFVQNGTSFVATLSATFSGFGVSASYEASGFTDTDILPAWYLNDARRFATLELSYSY